MKRSLVKPIALALLVTVTPVLSGCFGSFGATRLIYDLNSEISSNKFVQWIVFIILNVIPVYSVAVTVDVFLLNLLEFWTGSNLLVENGQDVPERVVQLEDGSIMVMNRDGYNSMSFELIKDGDAHDFKLDMSRDSARLTKGGELVGMLQAQPDGISVYDSEGQLLDSMGTEQQDAALAQFEATGPVGIIGWHQTRAATDAAVAAR